MNYKGYNIEIKESNDKNYPYVAVISKIGMQDITKRSYSKQQAITLAESEIDLIEAKQS